MQEQESRQMHLSCTWMNRVRCFCWEVSLLIPRTLFDIFSCRVGRWGPIAGRRRGRSGLFKIVDFPVMGEVVAPRKKNKSTFFMFTSFKIFLTFLGIIEHNNFCIGNAIIFWYCVIFFLLKEVFVECHFILVLSQKYFF